MADRVRQRNRMVVVAGRLHIVHRAAAEAADSAAGGLAAEAAADRLEVLAAEVAGLAVVEAEAISHPAEVEAMPHLAEAAEATVVGVTKLVFLPATNAALLWGGVLIFTITLNRLYKPRCFGISRASYRLVYDCITLPGERCDTKYSRFFFSVR